MGVTSISDQETYIRGEPIHVKGRGSTKRTESWRQIFQEVGARPPDDQFKELGRSWKEAVAVKAYQMMCEGRAMNLLPQIMAYVEPPKQEVEVNLKGGWLQVIEQEHIPL